MVRMRRTAIIVMLVLTAVTVGLTSVPVRAADTSTDISDTQVDQIRQNCKQAQSVLQRLHQTDAATRVTRGRIYESLLNRLIAPFNSRVSLNRYDASALTTTTTAINQKFTAFKTDYQLYTDSFDRLLSINCEADPRGFYTILVTTRAAREKVSNDISELNTLFDRYGESFNALSQSIEGQS